VEDVVAVIISRWELLKREKEKMNRRGRALASMFEPWVYK